MDAGTIFHLTAPVVAFILGTLFGMRVEVRGFSGIAEDIKTEVTKVKQEIIDLRTKFDAKKT